MRTLRALMFGVLAFFPTTILGLIIWWMMGSSMDTWEVAVWLPCNLVPFGGVSLGLWLGWKTGEEYSISADA
ncbi:MAG: hypothetical protein ACKVHH_00120 [Candidatus Poseidoniales archaeon]|jgi:hypothetical protein|tara:strand:+ start:262 stop:477 length:216 start_codon:yes stop_codon:yes gene_type:complete